MCISSIPRSVLRAEPKSGKGEARRARPVAVAGSLARRSGRHHHRRHQSHVFGPASELAVVERSHAVAVPVTRMIDFKGHRFEPDIILTGVRYRCGINARRPAWRSRSSNGAPGDRMESAVIRRPTVDCWRGGRGRNGRNPVGCYCRRRSPHRFPNDLPLTMHSSRMSERTRRTHPSRSMLVPSRSRTGSTRTHGSTTSTPTWH